MKDVSKIFDKVIHWITFITDWVIYVAKIFKALAAGVAAVRDNWPVRPIAPVAEEKEKPATGDNGNADAPRNIGANSQDVGSGVGA